MSSERKIALVTGSGRGIGRAIAMELANNGYGVAVNYSRSEGPAIEVCEKIRSLGVPAMTIKADVSDHDSVKAMFSAVKDELGIVDVLVNNAGITKDNLLMRMKDDDWSSVLASNLSSAFYCAREAIRPMIKGKWGRIINIASVVALVGNPGQANYVASKAGIIGLTKTLAREYGSKGITVNAVAPGFIESDMTRVLADSAREAMLAQIPLDRPGMPEDVAKMVAFLASEDAGYITGQVVAVDGGMTMC